MNIWESNVLRAAAKKVVAESREKTKGVKAVKDRDAINAEIITRHHQPIAGAFSRIQLVYMCGVIRGVLREPS